MSIEAMKLAAEFDRYFTSANGVDVPERVSVSRDEWRALFDAIQQTEAQQPATAIACGIPGMVKTTCPYCEQGFAFEHEQPATGEPMQADSSEHLRVIASLGAALRRLSFAAQTTGGTDGPDAELQSAIGQAEQALSLGGIWQAMSATPEPVWCVATGERVNGEETYTHRDAYVPLADCFPLYTRPEPSVPDGPQWFTVAEHGLPEVGEEVVGGLWYTDPWLKPECATSFMWGQCRVVDTKHRDFKDGKQWLTFGPSHNQITHWARLNPPSMLAAKKEKP